VTSLRIIDAGDNRDQWDDYVASVPRSTFSHLFGWKQIMTGVLGHEARYLAAIDGSGEWRAVLPMVRIRSMLGHFLISLPFLNDGGPLGEPEAVRSLVDHALAEAMRSGATLLELRSRDELPGPAVPSYRKLTVMLPLPSSVEDLWQRTIRAKLRSQIRRPMKEGMTFREGVSELDSFYRVFARNMRDLGTPVLPRSFFEHASSEFGSAVMFGTVYASSGLPVAAACCLLWREELEVTWASSLREFNHHSPNMLLYFRLMQGAVERGVRVFNFGRCSPGGTTHRFKQQWGGRDVPLPWPSWSREVGAGVPSADRALYRLAVEAWRHLPLAVANRVGPILARLLP
jgi:FemAB-related protein (PEP-CTERM system-associated)